MQPYDSTNLDASQIGADVRFAYSSLETGEYFNSTLNAGAGGLEVFDPAHYAEYIATDAAPVSEAGAGWPTMVFRVQRPAFVTFPCQIQAIIRIDGTPDNDILWGSTADGSGTAGASGDAEILAAIQTVLNKLNTVNVELVSPVSETGEFEIVQGDDYLIADGFALEWKIKNYTGPDPTDAALHLRMLTLDAYKASGTTVIPPDLNADGVLALVHEDDDTNSLSLTVELTAAQTATLTGTTPPNPALNYVAQAVVTFADGHQWTAFIKAATVKREL